LKPFIVIGLAAAALVAVGVVAAESMEGVIVKKPYDEADKKGHGGGGARNIVYNGGTVMTGAPVNVYVIYYGDYGADPAAPGIIDNFFTDLEATPGSYYLVNHTYFDSNNATIASTFSFLPNSGGVYIDNPPSHGTHISSKNMPAIILGAQLDGQSRVSFGAEQD
jgi:hypothetical protein